MMMEGMRVAGRVGVGVGVAIEDDMGDGMQCSDHPYRNNPGGICAFCLQEKLGKLVSSSFPLPARASFSSSSPSFRSDTGNLTSSGFASNGVVHASSSSSSSNPLSLPLSVKPTSSNAGPYQEYYTRWARIQFLLAKKKKVMATESSSSDHHHHRAADVVFKRSKSTATPRRGHYLDDGEGVSPRKRNRFWSFLYLSSSKPQSGSSRKMDKLSSLSSTETMSTASAAAVAAKEKPLGSPSMSKKGAFVVVEEDDSPNSQTNASASSFDRKVSRSRSVGCGSRSFSGDFFEMISTGFGDCTLRRVESQREGKSKASASCPASAMKERVKCGGIFGGFIMTSSSSSSSSSSYWVSEEVSGKPGGHVVQGRSRSSGWAFASPLRAFSSKPGRRDTVIREASTKNSITPNLSAIPSLLAVRS